MPRMDRSSVPLESAEQRIVVEWLRFNRIECFSAPSEGDRSGRFGSRLKAQGWRAGIPDLILLDLAPDGRPVAIEMKRVKFSKTTETQREFHALMRARGWHVIIGKGSDDAINKLAELGFGASWPRRATNAVARAT